VDCVQLFKNINKIMQKKYDIVTIGGVTEDISFYTKEGVLIENKNDILKKRLFAFEYGAKVRIDRSFSAFGGGAANAAVCLAKLGFKVAIIAVIGSDDRGNSVLKNFKENKVKTELVQKSSKMETGFSFLMVGPNNEHVVFPYRAANEELEITEKDLINLKKTKWIYLTSLSGKWKSVLRKIFSVEGVKIAWNPGNAQLSEGVTSIKKFLKKTEILTLNKDEAIELVVSDDLYFSKGDKFLNNTKNLLSIISGWGPRIVVVTNGEFGADAYDGKEFYHIDVLGKNKQVDTTGVGDAFGSTFVAGMEFFDGDIQKAMEICIKNTASVVAVQGAQNGLLGKSQILK